MIGLFGLSSLSGWFNHFVIGWFRYFVSGWFTEVGGSASLGAWRVVFFFGKP